MDSSSGLMSGYCKCGFPPQCSTSFCLASLTGFNVRIFSFPLSTLQEDTFESIFNRHLVSKIFSPLEIENKNEACEFLVSDLS